jgi:hypothetical protein
MLGTQLRALGIPVKTTDKGAFTTLANTLWSEVSGSDDGSLYQPIRRAVATLKKRWPH